MTAFYLKSPVWLKPLSFVSANKAEHFVWLEAGKPLEYFLFENTDLFLSYYNSQNS